MNANEFICGCIECEYYENGYCWGYAWPVENVKECDEWDMWKEANQLEPKGKQDEV